jgi:RIO kinase 1
MSRRRKFDDELEEHGFHVRNAHPSARPSQPTNDPTDDGDDTAWSSYTDALHGPSPVPVWVITDASAIDLDRGVLKTGKEAEVSLLERSHELTGRRNLLAAKRYRDLDHRLFHRDAGYLEGRRVRRSREGRAMANRTSFGRELIAGQWASAEFAVLSRLWSAGVAVPYPVQLDDTELLMEFIGDDDGTAAPRLAQTRPDPTAAAELYEQCRSALVDLAAAGFTHGDLSPYNVLVHQGRLVLIDLPQAVDLVGNPQGFAYLARDCENICSWFAARGVDAARADELERRLLAEVPGA